MTAEIREETQEERGRGDTFLRQSTKGPRKVTLGIVCRIAGGVVGGVASSNSRIRSNH